jgi:hypothetical protein
MAFQTAARLLAPSGAGGGGGRQESR